MVQPELKGNETILLSDVIAEAKKIFPDYNKLTALKQYSEIQRKIIRYTSDRYKSDEAYCRWQLAKLLLDAAVPDYDWQLYNPTEEN